MPRITALVHTLNDRLRIGRCLETLYPCDDILIVDHGSQDGTARVAHEYAAKVIPVDGNGRLDQCLRGADWILCLDARESLSEALAASLYEWKLEPRSESAYSMFLREETVGGWVQHSAPQTRLVPAGWKSWDGCLPANQGSPVQLAGEVLRFALP